MGSASDRDAAVQWEGGTEALQLEVLRSRISEQRQEVERTRKALSSKPRPTQPEGTPPLTQEEIDEDIWEQREMCTTKLAAMHREELELREREQRLRVERAEYLRQLRAVEAEDSAGRGGPTILQERYELLRLISWSTTMKVYRAYDLCELHHCMLRIHNLDASTREAGIESIGIECDAVKQLRHPGLASLLDHFPHESQFFVTVWEFCEGDSLEAYLLRNGAMPEKEARGVVLQILSILRFVEARGLQVRSKDLRTSRLTFHGGEVRVTDVVLRSLRRKTPGQQGGLTNITNIPSAADVAPDSCGSMEANGAEADALGGGADGAHLWTLGVTLHEMLFGKRPESRGVALLGLEGSAMQLPDQPKISSECREHLGHLLDRDRRLTVQEVYNDPFIAPARKQR